MRRCLSTALREMLTPHCVSGGMLCFWRDAVGCCSLCAALLSRATNCAWCFGRWERRAQSSARRCSQIIRETSYRQEPKERTSLWECCHMCWGLSGDRTLHSELSGEDFRAAHHKLSTRLLRVNETSMYNSSVTTLSILSSTLESGPPHDNHVSHTSGIIFACVRLGWVPGWAESQVRLCPSSASPARTRSTSQSHLVSLVFKTSL